MIKFLVMKMALLLLGALLVAIAPAQQSDGSVPGGVIYGTVVESISMGIQPAELAWWLNRWGLGSAQCYPQRKPI